jgi:hypothetical protein
VEKTVMDLPTEQPVRVAFEIDGMKRNFVITSMGPYTPGKRIFSHYEVREEGASQACELESWASVERYFISIGLGDQFKKRFPGPEHLKFV